MSSKYNKKQKPWYNPDGFLIVTPFNYTIGKRILPIDYITKKLRNNKDFIYKTEKRTNKNFISITREKTSENIQSYFWDETDRSLHRENGKLFYSFVYYKEPIERLLEALYD